MVDYIDVIKFFTALYRKAIFLKYKSNFSKPQKKFCLSLNILSDETHRAGDGPALVDVHQVED